MTEIKRTLILEVQEGIGTPDSIALEMGRATDPLSVGTDGEWKINAEGVLDLHAYFHFDGTRLFGQSVTSEEPAYVGGSPLGEAWTEIVAPATVTLGGARIVFRALSDHVPATAPDDFDDKTEVSMPPSSDDGESTRPKPMESPAAFSDDATRIEPIQRYVVPSADGDDEIPDSQAKTKINAPAYNPDLPTLISAGSGGGKEEPLPPVMVAPQTPRTSPAPLAPPIPDPVAPPSTTPTPKKAGLLQQWKDAPLARKVMVLLLPIALVSVFLIFREEPQHEEAPAPKAATSASAAPTMSAAPPSGGPIVQTVVANAAPAAPRDPDAAASNAERAAADAVASGAYADAIRMYDQLAAAHPDQPAFREAARILRAKLDAGAPTPSAPN